MGGSDLGVEVLMCYFGAVGLNTEQLVTHFGYEFLKQFDLVWVFEVSYPNI